MNPSLTLKVCVEENTILYIKNYKLTFREICSDPKLHQCPYNNSEKCPAIISSSDSPVETHKLCNACTIDIIDKNLKSIVEEEMADINYKIDSYNNIKELKNINNSFTFICIEMNGNKIIINLNGIADKIKNKINLLRHEKKERKKERKFNKEYSLINNFNKEEAKN